MKVHTLIESPTRKIFSEGGECLSESYVKWDGFKKKAKFEDMLVDGGGVREMAFVKHISSDGETLYFADKVTGSLYDAETGVCKSSSKLKLLIPV